MGYLVLIRKAEDINIEDAKRDLQELERIKEEEKPIKERLAENLEKTEHNRANDEFLELVPTLTSVTPTSLMP